MAVGVLVITNEDRIESYKSSKSELSKRCYGYNTDFVTDAQEVEKFTKKEAMDWQFCFIDDVDGLDEEKIRGALRGVPVYINRGGKLTLYNGGSEPETSVELNGDDASYLIKRILDDKEGRIKLKGNRLGGLGKLLRDLGDSRYQGMITMAEINILVVDDEKEILNLNSRVLSDEGYSVRTAVNGVKALELIKEGYRPDLLITDRSMPEMGGEELAEKFKEKLPGVPIIMSTSAYEESSLLTNPNIDYVLPKNGNLRDLIQKADEALQVSSR